VYCDIESEYNQRKEIKEISKADESMIEKFLKESYEEEPQIEEITEYTQRLMSFFNLLQDIDNNQSKISGDTND